MRLRFFVLREANEKLLGSVSPRLLMDHDWTLERRFRPHNLLAALWFQFFQTIQGQRRTVTFMHCHEWIDATGHRRSKKAHTACVYRRKISRLQWRKSLKAVTKDLTRKTLPSAQRRELIKRKKTLEAKLR